MVEKPVMVLCVGRQKKAHGTQLQFTISIKTSKTHCHPCYSKDRRDICKIDFEAQDSLNLPYVDVVINFEPHLRRKNES